MNREAVALGEIKRSKRPAILEGAWGRLLFLPQRTEA